MSAPPPLEDLPSTSRQLRKRANWWACGLVTGLLLIAGGLMLMIAGPLMNPEMTFAESPVSMVGLVAGGLVVFWVGTGLLLISAICFRDCRHSLQPGRKS